MLTMEIMATIKFVTNLHPFQNGREWQFHPNFFEGKDVKGDDVCDKNGKKISFPVPNEAGVYIVGVKIPVSDPKQFDENGKPIDKAVEKFCPLYVGIQKKIKNKIKGHRDPRNRSTSNGELNSYKELFDLSMPPSKFYKGIEKWNEYWCNKKGKERNLETLINEIKINGYDSMVFFPNPLFFEKCLSPNGLGFSHVSNTHDFFLQKNDNYKLLAETKLFERINYTKETIEKKYWYAYATKTNNPNIDFNDNSICQQIEAATKWKLIHTLGIPTYAGINGAGLPMWHRLKNHEEIDMEINLFDIKDDLVNMTGQTFNITQNDQNEQVFII